MVDDSLILPSKPKGMYTSVQTFQRLWTVVRHFAFLLPRRFENRGGAEYRQSGSHPRSNGDP